MKKSFVISVIVLVIYLIGAIFFYYVEVTFSANFASVLIGFSLIELLEMRFSGAFKKFEEKLENKVMKYRYLLIKLRLDNTFVIVLSNMIFVVAICLTSLPAIVQFLLVIFFSMTTFVSAGVYRNLKKQIKGEKNEQY